MLLYIIYIPEPSKVSTSTAETVVSQLLLGLEKKLLGWLGRVAKVTEVGQGQTSCTP